ncbi:uncharacterized protein C19orf44 homolog [Lampris incognitus]|uniref:uncharacterized protein C19orf44 homolog n=1 Tax=Lampris incognitus TaxID=2546036 RepID=UPI0024B512D3|nr:uncharacterized protein C19orf44 homolog [Lampris incognitus]
MWKRGSRSSALERAQALLARKGSASGNNGPGNNSPAKTAPSNTHVSFLDLSDLSSASEHGYGTMGSAAAGQDPPKEPRPQTSLGGRGGSGSRFLKKATPPATISRQSPIVGKSEMTQPTEPRDVSFLQRSSQNAALNRLALIKEGSKQAGTETQGQEREGPKTARILSSDPGVSFYSSPSQSFQAPMPLLAQSNNDVSLRGKRYLKKNAAAAAVSSAVPPKEPEVSVKMSAADTIMSKGRPSTATASVSHASLGAKPVKVVSGVSLDSDEEDMRKLLGDSFDSTEDSLPRPARATMTEGKSFSKIKHNGLSSPPPSVHPMSSSHRMSSLPPGNGSSFHPSSLARDHLSPPLSVPSASVVLSPSPSPPYASPLLPGRPGSPSSTGSPPSCRSSTSGQSEIHSLAELFPVAPNSHYSHSERSRVSTEDFKMNIMTLDDLVPDTLGFTEETIGEQHKAPAPRDLQDKGQKEEEVGDEDVLDYESDFESQSSTAPELSEISEHLGEDREGEEEEDDVSEIGAEVSGSDRASVKAEDSYSSRFSTASRSYATQTSTHSDTTRSRSRRRDFHSKSSVSHSDHSSSHTMTPSHRSEMPSSPRTAVRDAVTQTKPDLLAYSWSAGMATLGPAMATTYVDPAPVASHTVSAEAVEALSTYSPAVFALNDMLRQQLTLTRQFIHTSRHLHSCLLQSLGADYTYTTLEDTKEFICKHKPPKLSVEKALEEVLQEMRDYHYI